MLYTPKGMTENPLPIKTGALSKWYSDAMDEEYWEWMIDDKLRKPHLNIPPPSDRNAPQEDPSPPPSPRNRSSSPPHLHAHLTPLPLRHHPNCHVKDRTIPMESELT